MQLSCGVSDEFMVIVPLNQGSTLSLFLFILVKDKWFKCMQLVSFSLLVCDICKCCSFNFLNDRNREGLIADKIWKIRD